MLVSVRNDSKATSYFWTGRYVHIDAVFGRAETWHELFQIGDQEGTTNNPLKRLCTLGSVRNNLLLPLIPRKIKTLAICNNTASSTMKVNCDNHLKFSNLLHFNECIKF